MTGASSARPGPGRPGRTPARIAFLSDFGADDEFVGVVHAVLDQHAPGARVIDVSHAVPAHDIGAGALTLWRAAPWLVPGVILAVVDPGVGTDRRPVAVEVAGAGTALVGPDNGLLLPAALLLGPITGAVQLDPAQTAGARPAPLRDRPAGATFAGRDLFAPAAGRLAAGAPLTSLGAPIDPAGLAGRSVPTPEVTAGGLLAEVLWVDHFGNAQLNATRADVDGSRLVVDTGHGQGFAARVVDSYGDIAPDPFALVVDSYGFLAICSDGRPAAPSLGLRPGLAVRLSRECATPR